MEAYYFLLGTWELDPTRPSISGAGGFVKFTHYRFTTSVSEDGRNVTLTPEGMKITLCCCFPIPEYKEGTQVGKWDDEQQGYHFPGHPGDDQSPEYIMRETGQGVFKAFGPESGKEIMTQSLEGSDKMRIEGPKRGDGRQKNAGFVLCMRRVGPRPSPPVLSTDMSTVTTAVVTPATMVSPTAMTIKQHGKSAEVDAGAMAGNPRPGCIYVTVPAGKKGGDIMEDFLNPKSGMPMMVLIPFNKKEGDVFEQFVG